MRIKLKKGIFCGLLAIAGWANAQNLEVTPVKYRIEKVAKVDSAIIHMLQPYKDSLDQRMNKVIGFSTNGLSKKPMESVLGNFMADCLKTMSEKVFNQKVDAAFVNYGGIRSYLPKGNITAGKIFELMPFDNLIVLQQLPGDTLQSFLNKVAERGGWPVSGITFGIKDKKAVNIFINGTAFDASKTYIIANSDYVANGGDDCSMLRSIKQINKGYLFRDALINYIETLTAEGKSIDAQTENRVTYAN